MLTEKEITLISQETEEVAGFNKECFALYEQIIKSKENTKKTQPKFEEVPKEQDNIKFRPQTLPMKEKVDEPQPQPVQPKLDQQDKFKFLILGLIVVGLIGLRLIMKNWV